MARLRLIDDEQSVAPARKPRLVPLDEPSPVASPGEVAAVETGPAQAPVAAGQPFGSRLLEGVQKALAYGVGALTGAGRGVLEQNPIGMAISRFIDPKREAVTMERIAEARRPRAPLAAGVPLYGPSPPPELSEPSGPLLKPGEASMGSASLRSIVSGLKSGLTGYRLMMADVAGDEKGAGSIVRELRDEQRADLARRGHVGDEPVARLKGAFGPQSPVHAIVPRRSEVVEAVRQAATQLPGIGLALATRRQAPALVSMGAEILPREYGHARVEGFDPVDALVSSIGQTGAELVTESPVLRVAMNTPIGVLRRDPQAVAALAKYFSKVAGVEIGSEEASTVLGHLVDRGMANPMATPAQLQTDLLATFRQMLVQGPLMGAGASAMRSVPEIATRARREVDARRLASAIDEAEIVEQPSRPRTEAAPPGPRLRPITEGELPAPGAEMREPIEVTPPTNLQEAIDAARKGIQQRGDLAQHSRADAQREEEGAYRYEPPPLTGEDAQAGDRDRVGQGPVLEEDVDAALEKMGVAKREGTKGRTFEQSRLERTLARDPNVGAPSNQRIVLKDKAGELVVGRITKKDWLKRAQKSLGTEEFSRSRKWYRKLNQTLSPIFGERTTNVALAWLLSQQQASPSHGMMNVLRAIDRAEGHPGPKAGLNEAALLRALRTGDVEGGMGAKLADFIDSEMGSETRRIMGGDPRGGQPAAVDVHAFRDVGFVDQTMLRAIADRFGEDAAAQVSEDLNLTGEASYEYGSRFYNELARWLNDNKVDGGGWTASEAQAVGWMSMQAALGKKGESVEDIIGRNTRRVSIGLSPGEGSGGRVLSHDEAEKIVKDVSKAAGATLLELERNVGAYLGQNENSLHVSAFASPETVRAFINAVGYAMRQTSVIAVRPLKTGKQDAIDLVSEELLDVAKAGRFFSALHQQEGMRDLVPGFQQIDMGEARGLRLLNFGGHWSQKQLEKIHDAIGAASEMSGIPIEDVVHFPIHLEEASNDWTAQQEGQGYLDAIRQAGRPALSQWLERNHGPSAPASEGSAARSAERIFGDYEGAKRAYLALPDTHGGQILNVDLARELVPEYRANPNLAPEVHEPASAFIKKLYAEKLAGPTPAGKVRAVVFSGGGPGSGKSTSLSHFFGSELDIAEMFYDATMSGFESTRSKIDQALKAGRGVVLRFVDRDPGEAYEYGVVNRMAGKGTKRLVLMGEHAKAHVEARETLRKLEEHYAGNAMVDIAVVRKYKGNGTRPVDTAELGQWSYDDAYRETTEAARRARDAGRLTEEQYAAAGKGSIPRGAEVARQETDEVDGGERERRVPGRGIFDLVGEAGQFGVAAVTAGTAPVKTRKADPAKVGMATYDPTNVMPQIAARVGTFKEQRLATIAGAVQDLYDAGLPRYMVETIKGWVGMPPFSGSAGMYFPRDRLIALASERVVMASNGHRESLARMRSDIAHELAHNVDVSGIEHGELEALTLNSDRMYQGGDLYDEAFDLYNDPSTPSHLREYFDYPFGYEDQMRSGGSHPEIFAQVSSLYFTRPAMVKKYLPAWQRVMEVVYGQQSGGTAEQQLEAASRRLRQALSDEGADLGRAGRRPAGGAGEARVGVAKRQAGPGVGAGAASGSRPPGGGAILRGGAGRPAPAVNWNVEQPGLFESIVRELQNKVVDLKAVEAAIRAAGGVLDSRHAPYLTEELYHGRVSEMTDRFIKREAEPLVKAMASRRITPGELGDYLWARHAPEANARLARINPSGATNLAGMSDAEAAQRIATFKQQGKLDDLRALAKMIDEITNGTREHLVREGLIDQDTVDTWEKTYKHYVPLFREQDEIPGTGQGFKVRGEESKRRTGSEKGAVDIVAAVIAARERAIIRGEKAKVGRDLVKMAEEFPNENFWKVDSPPMTQRIDPRTGLVLNTIDPLYFNREDVFVVKEKDPSTGKVRERVITFNPNNERALKLSRAMQNLDVVRLAGLTKFVNKVSRYFANLATQWNPLFWATNFVRDIQTAGVNLQSTPLAGQAGKVFARIPSALAGMTEAEFGKGNSKWAKWYEEYKAAGGKTGWLDVFDSLRDRQVEIEALVAKAERGPASVMAMADWTADVVQKTNSIIENGTRLAAYVVAREQGLSEREAASLAKNLTVNFNRKGNRSSAANAWFMFLNANIQGNARMLRGLAQSKRAWAIVGTMTALGAAQELINRMIGDDDRDEYGNNAYEMISDWEKERNWILMKGRNERGDPDYLKIPLPYGFNIFPAAGRLAMEAVLGASRSSLVTEKRDPLELAASMANTLIDAFAPLGQTSTAIQFFAPTIADPFVQIWENRKFSGVRMVPENEWQKAIPRSELYFTSTSEVAKDMTRWLNQLSGGSQIEPGWLDVYPGHLEHAFRTLTGGPGVFALGMFEFGQHTGEKVMGREPQPMQASRIPFVGKFYGEVDERAIEAKFYRLREKADPIAQRIKALRKAGDAEAAARLEEENVPLVEFAREVARGAFKKRQRSMGEELRETRELPLADRESAKREIKRERSELFQRAIEAYNAAARERRP